MPKYCHSISEKFAPPELAILAELLLRGPQTLGELRSRCERMASFAGIAAVEEAIKELEQYEQELLVLLPRQPGQKEPRYAHLLSGAPPVTTAEQQPPPEAARIRVMAEDERLVALEEEVAVLRAEVAALHQAMADFKAQFE